MSKLPQHIYHLAEAANWPSIQRHGLLSASKLLEFSGYTGDNRHCLERAQRREHTELVNGIQIRDQGPMPPTLLARCLVGLTPAEWYATINARVFFWLDPDRLNRQRVACEPRSQVVLILDTALLVEAYHQNIALSPINTGFARRKPARRGAATFVPYSQWIKSGWASEAASLGTSIRKLSHPPVELTIKDSVPDVLTFIVDVKELNSGQLFVL